MAVTSAGDQMETIGPYIEEATAYVVTNYLGQAFYEELLNKYQNDATTPLDANWKGLLTTVQRIIANLGYFYYIPFNIVQISNSGARVAQSDEMKAAEQWQINQLNTAIVSATYNAIESLLAYLDSKLDVFTTWKESDYAKISVELIVSSALEFQKFYNINQQRRTYNAMRSIINKVQDFEIRDCIGDKNYDELKAGLKNRNLPPKWNNVMYDLKGAVVNYTIGRACTELKLQITKDGVAVTEFTYRQSLSDKRTGSALDVQLMRQQAMADGDRYLRRVRDYLIDNASDFNDYTGGDPQSTKSYPTATNKKENGTFWA